jgi:hypothetical protein
MNRIVPSTAIFCPSTDRLPRLHTNLIEPTRSGDMVLTQDGYVTIQRDDYFLRGGDARSRPCRAYEDVSILMTMTNGRSRHESKHSSPKRSHNHRDGI